MAQPLLIAYSYQENKPTLAPEELRDLIDICKGKIPPLELPGATDESILQYFKSDYGADIQIFHFAGHAVDKNLVLDGTYQSETECYLDMRYFSKLIGSYGKGLRLVFLNACKTDEQAQFLLDAGIPAVIATSIPVNDRYAFLFAREFYAVLMKGEKTLQEALEEAHNRLNGPAKWKIIGPDGKQLNEEWMDDRQRGVFMLDQPRDPDHIYQLFGSDAVKNQTFADWQNGKPAIPASHITDQEKSEPVNMGPSREFCYLLCDRGQQAEVFEQILQGKMAGASPEPSFIFINGHNADGIPELHQRVEKYILPGVCTTNHRRIEWLKFPDLENFDLPNDPKKPLLYLEDTYEKNLISKNADRTGDDTLYLLCHKILEPTWKNGMESLFEYYLGDYSKTMAQKIGKRIVVLVFLQYYDEQEQTAESGKFVEMCQRLKAAYQTRVDFFDKLPLIKRRDITDWHESEFKAGIDTLKYPIAKKEMYFVEARDVMIDIIKGSKNNA